VLPRRRRGPPGISPGERRKSMIWNEKDQEEAKKRGESPEAGRHFREARRLLDEATEALWSAGELDLAERVYTLLGVVWGAYKLEDVWPQNA
jgi:hypothetical protein